MCVERYKNCNDLVFQGRIQTISIKIPSTYLISAPLNERYLEVKQSNGA